MLITNGTSRTPNFSAMARNVATYRAQNGAEQSRLTFASDLLVVNKIDLAPHVGASLEVMRLDADRMRQGGPTIFARARDGHGVDEVIGHVLAAFHEAAPEAYSLAKVRGAVP